MFKQPKPSPSGEGDQPPPDGTGPFEFVEWVPKDRLTVSASRATGVQALAREDHLQARPRARRGGHAGAGGRGHGGAIPIQDVSRLRANPKLHVMMVDSPRQPALRPEHAEGDLQGRARRQAVNYAVDKEAIVKNIYNGLAVPLTKFAASRRSSGYAAVGDYYKYDPPRPRTPEAAGVTPGTKL